MCYQCATKVWEYMEELGVTYNPYNCGKCWLCCDRGIIVKSHLYILGSQPTTELGSSASGRVPLWFSSVRSFVECMWWDLHWSRVLSGKFDRTHNAF